MVKPLDGIKVLDLSRYLPGPLCTQILADFGAEVVKVEDPSGGELGRQVPPYIEGESARFYTVNRNKKSLSLNLKKQEGKEIFKKLSSKADIIVDQFRPGVMEKMGLGYENLKELNKRLIYCKLSGYGMTGPMCNNAGHDLNYLNIAGVTELTGNRDGDPAMCGVQIADTAGGSLFSVISILLAIAAREKTGEGQLCDVAMLDSAISLLAYTIGAWSGEGKLPQRGDDLLMGGYACYSIYECQDGKHIGLGAIEKKFWAEFCRRIDKEEYIEEQNNRGKQEIIKADIKQIILQKSRDEWVEFFSDLDICFTPVLTLDEMAKHPQVLAREMIRVFDNYKGSGKDLVLTGIPIKLSATPGETKFNFPALGEHNREILMAIGYLPDQIAQLRANQVI